MFFPTIHKASLVDASLHPPALLELVDVKLDRTVTEYLIDSVVETVDYALGRPSPSRRGRSLHRHSENSAFATCVYNVIERAEVEMPVVLATLVYLQRAKPHLHIALEEWACERVFLGALIVASKYLNDSSLKNVHWAVCTGVFGKRDIGRIEREFLDVLDFELGVSESDILSLHEPIMAIVSPPSHHYRSQISAIVETPSSFMDVDLSPSSSSSDSSELESSSPTISVSHSNSSEESDLSLSPRTPPTLVDGHEPEVVKPQIAHLAVSDSHSHPHQEHSVPHSHHPEKRHSVSASTLRLLRSFPMPGRHHTSCSSHAQFSQASVPPPHHRSTHPRCQSSLPLFPTQPTTRVCV
ncbi:uncharacterized protein STEHIDRAFT_144986 [Stereum hirsutum FP-91666 SS1]|uniref:uncharacterized protein n=1 Tax=Stereum hirsutum (strain FP-91666) TaxID=721885 RepID=UPI000440AF0D|nr:uncharacterized protein STEHIDRAFT_144986 [Stereum hirsutum FP-91666 SS1]EIM89736.1 hypothetical protein STEHIDRAFT_144986 [Stereum hirsutum FP-91666 SS1]